MSIRNSHPPPVQTTASNESRLQYVLRVGAAHKPTSSLVVGPAAGTVARPGHCLYEPTSNLALLTVGTVVPAAQKNEVRTEVDELDMQVIKNVLHEHVVEAFAEGLIRELASDFSKIYELSSDRSDVIELSLALNKQILHVGVLSSRIAIQKQRSENKVEYRVDFWVSCRDTGAGAIAGPVRSYTSAPYFLGMDGILKDRIDLVELHNNFNKADPDQPGKFVAAIRNLKYMKQLTIFSQEDEWRTRSSIEKMWTTVDPEAIGSPASMSAKILEFEALAMSLPELYYTALQDMFFNESSRFAKLAKDSFYENVKRQRAE